MPINTILSGTTVINLTVADEISQVIAGAVVDVASGDAIELDAIGAALYIDGDVITAGGDAVDGNFENNVIHIRSGGSVLGSSDGVTTSGVNTVIINDGMATGTVDEGLQIDGAGSILVNNGIAFGGNNGLYMSGDNQTVINTGLVTSDGNGVISLADNAIIVNSGIIRGTNEGVLFNSGSTFSSTLINSGTIRATNGPRAIEGSDGIETIINTGTLLGNVSLDGGNDFYDGRGGTITGTVFGEAGADRMIGGTGAEGLNGGFGNDTIFGGGGADLIAGASGNDFLRGDGGNDTIRGGGGNDTMLGGFGADLLNGFSGDDVMDGGAGNDQLIGGLGADTFQFQLNAGNDRIFGWEDGTDEIDLTSYDIAHAATLNLAISAVAGNAVVDLAALGGTGTITINGAAGDITDADFIF